MISRPRLGWEDRIDELEAKVRRLQAKTKRLQNQRDEARAEVVVLRGQVDRLRSTLELVSRPRKSMDEVMRELRERSAS